MAVSKSSYAKLFADLSIWDKVDADEIIRKEYKKAKHSKKSENLPKYLSEMFEVLIGSMLIDNKYHFGRTNFLLVGLLEEKLYKTLDKKKDMFKVINHCIELIQGILKEHKDEIKDKAKEQGKEITQANNQQVTFQYVYFYF